MDAHQSVAEKTMSFLGAENTIADSSLDNSVSFLLNRIAGKPLVVALVGLPGRGKTIISTKLKRLLTWNKIVCEGFHLSAYRRLIAPHFPEHLLNEPLRMHETELREQCTKMLFDELDNFFNPSIESSTERNSHLQGTFLHSDSHNSETQSEIQTQSTSNKSCLPFSKGDVAIFDAANTLRCHRQELMDFCQSRDYDVFFIETITDDLELIKLYIDGIEQSNPDYWNLTKEEAVLKFEQHYQDYAKTYEPLCSEIDAKVPFLQIYDGGARCLVHNMTGYVQSKIVYYLTNLHFARQPIYLTRHGEAVNNTLGIIGGDTGLTARGFKYADAFADYINNLDEVKHPDRGPGLHVWTSVLQRTKQTAARIQAPVLAWNALIELDAGDFDGKSMEFIKRNHPFEFERRQEDKFRYRYPNGESYDDLVTRLEPVIMELERTRETIVIVCHRGVMRCLLAYFLNNSFEELPYLEVPLHKCFKITPQAYGYEVETIDHWKIPAYDDTDRMAGVAMGKKSATSRTVSSAA